MNKVTFQIDFDARNTPFWTYTYWAMSNGWGGSPIKMRPNVVHVNSPITEAMRLVRSPYPVVMRYYPRPD